MTKCFPLKPIMLCPRYKSKCHHKFRALILSELEDEKLMVTLYIMDDVGSQIRGIKFPCSEYVSVMHTVTQITAKIESFKSTGIMCNSD